MKRKKETCQVHNKARDNFKDCEENIDFNFVDASTPNAPKSHPDSSKQADSDSLCASFLRNSQTPRTKKKSKLTMKSNLSSGLINRFRNEVGINLSNPVQTSTQKKSRLELTIEQFFEREDVSRVTPDTRKVATNPDDKLEKKQIRYRLEHLKTIYLKFIAEENMDCSYS